MNFIAWMIVVCEIAFWVVILIGLSLRYVFKLKKLGFFFLALTPLIDIILIAITSLDLYRGATATVAHGLAAVYIAVSLAFGKNMIAWMDVRFQRFILKSTTFKQEKLSGIPHAKNYAKGFVRHIIAYVIGYAILASMIFYIGDASRTEALSGILKIWGFILAIDLYITASYFIWPKKPKTVSGSKSENV